MKRIIFLICCLAMVPVSAKDAKIDPSRIDPSRIDPDVKIHKLSDRIFMHTGFYRFDAFTCPSHGIIAAGDGGIVLVDTQWNDAQTETLLGMIEKQFGRKVVLAVITHAHADKIGGIDALRRHGIETISTAEIAESAAKNGYSRPDMKITKTVQMFNVRGIRFEAYFPGAAHTKDNIVVYFPDEKVLFAGCIIKGMNETTLGNTADGDIKAYSSTVRNLMKRYAGAAAVVTSHSDPGGAELMTHTLELAVSILAHQP